MPKNRISNENKISKDTKILYPTQNADKYTKRTVVTKIIITFLPLIRETHLSSH